MLLGGVERSINIYGHGLDLRMRPTSVRLPGEKKGKKGKNTYHSSDTDDASVSSRES